MTDATDVERTSAFLDAIADGGEAENLVTEPVDESVPEPVEAEVEAPAEPVEPDVQDEAPADPPVITAASPYIPPVRENAQAMLDQIAAERADLLEQVTTGEIAIEEYHDRMNRLVEIDTDIKAEIRANRQWAEYAQHQEQMAKGAAYAAFKAIPENQVFASDKRVFTAFNDAFMELEADPAAQAKGYAWMLDEAKRLTTESFAKAIGATPPAPAPANVTDIRAKAQAKVAAVKQPAPLSLSDIPGAPGAAATEFERLDQAAPGFDKFDALSSMPPEKLEAWMNRRI